MTDFPAARVQALKDRIAKASGGPWMPRRAAVLSDGGYDFAIVAEPVNADNIIAEVFARGGKTTWHNAEANADFIAHAREDLPDLLAGLEAQGQTIARLTAERDAARSQFDRHVEWTRQLWVADHFRSLGDGAFVCRSDGDAWIYTTNGETVTARIALGPAELLRLQDWIAQIFARRA